MGDEVWWGVVGAGASAIGGEHEAFEDGAEHARVDGGFSGAFVGMKGVAGEEVDEGVRFGVGQIEVGVGAFDGRGFEEAAVEERDGGEARVGGVLLVEGGEEEGLEGVTEQVARVVVCDAWEEVGVVIQP